MSSPTTTAHILGNEADGPSDNEPYVDAARRLYADKSSDDIEVDDNARVIWTGDTESGDVWVEAWVYVPARAAKNEEQGR